MSDKNLTLAANPSLFVAEIKDVFLQKNFEALREYFNAENQLYGFKFAEVVFDRAVERQALPHGLGVIPQDILVTRITGTGKVSFLYGSFDSTNIYLSSDGPCRIRFFYGTYWNFISQVNNNSSDKMVVESGA